MNCNIYKDYISQQEAKGDLKFIVVQALALLPQDNQH